MRNSVVNITNDVIHDIINILKLDIMEITLIYVKNNNMIVILKNLIQE